MNRELEIYNYWEVIPEDKIKDGIIVYGPDLLQQSGIFMIGTIKLKYILPNRQEKIVQSIIVNDLFIAQSENTQNFFIAHEMGHIKNNDLDTPLFMKNTKWNRFKYIFSCKYGVPEIEKEADKYAVSIVGKENAIMALESLCAFSRCIRKQVERRVKIIRNM